MKLSKIYILFAILAFTVSFTAGARAATQYLVQDVAFLKFGYIPNYTVEIDDRDYDSQGLAVQGEYNFSFTGVWLGVGVEYQYIRQDVTSGDEINNHFIIPMATVKFGTIGGLYLGAGVSGKYLIATESFNGQEFDKKIDLWVNGIIGYQIPVSEVVFLDLEGRFGWNLTNNQFDDGGGNADRAYDIGVYAGVGFRSFGATY